jgi:hypothetical protein
MIQWVVSEPSGEFPDIETGFDLLKPGGIDSEDPVHPSVDLESISVPIE